MAIERYAKGKRKLGDVSYEEFVAAWQTSDSVKEVSDRLSVSRGSISGRAKRLRESGVRLKKLGYSGPFLTNPKKVDELNDLIDGLGE